MPIFLDAQVQGFVHAGSLRLACLYIAILIVMALILSANVAVRRGPLQIGIGDGGNPVLQRMMRIQGNFMEYAPFCIGALIMLSIIGAPSWAIHTVGGTMVVGRILHAVGIYQTAGISFGRGAGMLLTFASLLSAAWFLIWFGWR